MSAFQIEFQDPHVILRLSGDVTIEHARELHTGLVAALGAGRVLQIDATAATRIDAAILQILAAAAAAAARAELTAGSAAWDAALDRFAFNPLAVPSGNPSTP
jgi:anti-anti-sigma regulatory factor